MNAHDNRLKNLVLLRWVAFLGMAVVFLAMYYLMGYRASNLSYAVVFMFGLSNGMLFLLSAKTAFSLKEYGSLLILTADSLCLTFLLHDNGGAHNPFSILFLAIASVGALMLPLSYLLLLIIASLLELGFIYSSFSGSNHQLHHLMTYDSHLHGMWMANSLGVFLICAWIYYLRSLNDKMAVEQEKSRRILSGIEHMESLGRLAASAAHQLNTPVGTLQLGLSELTDEASPLADDEKKRWYHDMQQAIFQMTKIIDRLKPAISQNEDALEPVELTGFVKSVTQHWAIPRKVETKLDVMGASKVVRASVMDDWQTILTALLDNAKESNFGSHPLEIILKEEASFIILGIKDKGEGMDTETKKRALDPLFTTKAKGTGLGLYIVHQLARKYGGHVDIESAPNCGTTVRVFFKKDLL